MKAKLLLATAAVLLCALLLELALRSVGFAYHLYPQEIQFGSPNPTRVERAFRVDRDLFWVSRSYFKKLERARSKRPSLVFMGDSCTQFGEYDEFFAELLRTRSDVGTELSYSNLGVGGWSTHQGLRQLERDVVPIEPRVITLYYGWNDHWIGFGIEDKTVTWINSSIAFQLLEFSRLAQLVTKAFIAPTGGREEWPLRVAPDDFRTNLTEMVRLARSNNITPVLLTAPTSHQEGKEPEYLLQRHIPRLEDLVPLHKKYAAIVREVAATQNAILCDLAREFEKLPADQLHRVYFQEDGIHLRGPGDSYIASLLYDCFADHDLLDDLVGSPERGRSP